MKHSLVTGLLIGLVVLLGLIFSGCGGGGTTTSSNSSSTSDSSVNVYNPDGGTIPDPHPTGSKNLQITVEKRPDASGNTHVRVKVVNLSTDASQSTFVRFYRENVNYLGALAVTEDGTIIKGINTIDLDPKYTLQENGWLISGDKSEEIYAPLLVSVPGLPLGSIPGKATLVAESVFAEPKGSSDLSIVLTGPKDTANRMYATITVTNNSASESQDVHVRLLRDLSNNIQQPDFLYSKAWTTDDVFPSNGFGINNRRQLQGSCTLTKDGNTETKPAADLISADGLDIGSISGGQSAIVRVVLSAP